MALLDKLLGNLVTRGRLTVVLPSGREQAFGPGGGAEMRIKVADRATMLAIARDPRLGFGEAYMDGRVTIERGTLLELMELIVGGNPWERKGAGRKALNRGKKWWKSLFRRNEAKAARRNVAHHYDIGNGLYRLFLDDDLQYSCAYYTDPANSLEQAQSDKKAHIAAKLALKPGQRVLDIGCGWGGTALYLHRVADVDVLGITLSEEQLKVARQRAEQAGVGDRVKFELVDYREVEGRFDRIVSIGMFEHVGAAHYDAFFERCRALLEDEGVMLLHTIGKYGKAGKPDPFTDKYIFPGYHLPSLEQITAASGRSRLITCDVETLRLHYAYTLREWLARTTANRAAIIAMYDERFLRMWEFYLAGGIVGFENGTMCNYQLQYVRNRRALPIVRDYMIADEHRYRAMDGDQGPAQRKAGPRAKANA